MNDHPNLPRHRTWNRPSPASPSATATVPAPVFGRSDTNLAASWVRLTKLSHLTPSCFEDSPIGITPIPPLQHRVEHKHLSTLIFRSKAQQLWGASQGPSSAVGHTGTGWNWPWGHGDGKLRHVERFEVVTHKILLAVLLDVGASENSERDGRAKTLGFPSIYGPKGSHPQASGQGTHAPQSLGQSSRRSQHWNIYWHLRRASTRSSFNCHFPRQTHFLGRNVVPFQISVSLKNRLPKDGQDW